MWASLIMLRLLTLPRVVWFHRVHPRELPVSFPGLGGLICFLEKKETFSFVSYSVKFNFYHTYFGEKVGMSFNLTQNAMMFELMGNKSKGYVSGEDFSILYLLLQRQHHFTIKYARYEIEVKK